MLYGTTNNVHYVVSAWKKSEQPARINYCYFKTHVCAAFTGSHYQSASTYVLKKCFSSDKISMTLADRVTSLLICDSCNCTAKDIASLSVARIKHLVCLILVPLYESFLACCVFYVSFYIFGHSYVYVDFHVYISIHYCSMHVLLYSMHKNYINQYR